MTEIIGSTLQQAGIEQEYNSARQKVVEEFHERLLDVYCCEILTVCLKMGAAVIQLDQIK